MKTVYLNEDVNTFINDILQELQTGSNVLISMYGYKALVYKESIPEKVRIGIKRKLKAIKNLEINLYNLRRYSGLSDEQIDSIQKLCTPDEIADICLDYGLVLSSKKI